ncbi:FkbM family methyltransferase [Mesoterricola silvestris]|uniref:Methyltransferase FkbM domain-containing protein n=1 Tax=Mesoterricola silvestris TaxID=2927979 RepID=A0AA48K6N8_9BACT|nr:FkbM family methyltransferase [Mesoterricola silvestris]BDU71014.1 hypothetical protein METEAL_01880 [Mesoterricola silvestris]
MTQEKVPIPAVVRKSLELFPPVRAGRKVRAVAYPAGKLTRAMVDEGLFGALDLVGVADRAPQEFGGTYGALPVVPAEGIPALGPDAVLICSTRFHLSIHAELTALLAGSGIDVVDLCRDFQVPRYRDLAGRAERKGFALVDEGPGLLRLREPGSPGRSVLARTEHWTILEWTFRRFDDFFHDILPVTLPSGEQVLDFSRPGYHTYRASGARLFTPSVVQPEGLLYQYLDLVHPAPGEVVLDLGAFNGDSAYHFSKAVGANGLVVAVEADPVNFQALERNVRELGLANVRMIQAAVWSTDGMASFQCDGAMSSGLTDGFDFDLEGGSTAPGQSASVRTIRLETLLREHQLDRVDVVKIDTEGAELAILVSSMPTLRRLHPRIILEPHANDHPGLIGDMLGVLAEGGFKAEYLETDNLIVAR